MKKIFKFIIKLFFRFLFGLIFLILVFYLYENRNPGYHVLSNDELLKYTQILSENSLAPADYVISKFKEHNVVIIGEPHRVHEHYQFIEDLLPKLQENNINYVGFELLPVRIQEKIDRLMESDVFDETAAREIVLNCFPGFYYNELYTIVKKVWELNRNGREFHLIALDNISDKDYKMAEIANSYVQQGHKILVYCGTHHAFTKYYQPIPIPWKNIKRVNRMGQYLLHHFKADPFFINLHYPFAKKYWLFIPVLLYQKGYAFAFSGIPDQIFEKYGQPAGIDSSAEGFRDIKDTFSYYSTGQGEIKMEDFCDGYIFLNSLKDYSFVTPLEKCGHTDSEITIISSAIEMYHGKSEITSRLQNLFRSEESIGRILGEDGISPAEMLEMLDKRGLENVF